jgi:hypothetical protein
MNVRYGFFLQKILKALGGPDKKQHAPVEPHDIEEVSLHPFEDRYFQQQPGHGGGGGVLFEQNFGGGEKVYIIF